MSGDGASATYTLNGTCGIGLKV